MLASRFNGIESGSLTIDTLNQQSTVVEAYPALGHTVVIELSEFSAAGVSQPGAAIPRFGMLAGNKCDLAAVRRPRDPLGSACKRTDDDVVLPEQRSDAQLHIVVAVTELIVR